MKNLITNIIILLMFSLNGSQEKIIVKKDIAINTIENKIRIGIMSGNKKIKFGIKNIFEETISSIPEWKLIQLDSSTVGYPYLIDAEIIFFDVVETESNISIFHSSEEAVVIRMKGTLSKNNKVLKETIVEDVSVENSVSTLLINEEDSSTFSDESLRSAIKKASENLIIKLLK